MEGWVCGVTFRGTCGYVEGKAQIERLDFNTGFTVYRGASSISSDVDVVSWSHYCRGYIQMATTAATVAMDTGKSTYGLNPDLRSLCCSVHDGLHQDITFWYELRVVEENTVQPVTH